MSGKLEGLRAINTNTLTNPFCLEMKESDTICGQCYSHRMLNSYRKSCAKPWQINSDILSTGMLTEIPAIKDPIFRFHGHGELINMQHLLNLYEIARHNSDTTFALWTKRKDLINRCPAEKPDNLILIWSNPLINNVKDVPKGFDKVFNNITDEDDTANCTGQRCNQCRLCYTHGGTNVIVEHVK